VSVEVRPATEDDVLALHDRLRPEDEAEVKAACGHSPMKSLLHGLQHGKCWTVEYEGRPAAMFGVIKSTLDPTIGYVWLVGSKDIEAFPITFLRQSKEWLEKVAADYDLVTNMVDCRNTVHLRWLRWLEFELGRVVDRFGVEERPFVSATYYACEYRQKETS